VSDEYTVPLCRGHHREVHRRGDEAAWWNDIGVDALVSARNLWTQTHPIRSRDNETNITVARSITPATKKLASLERRQRGTTRKTKPNQKTI
jgi:hypothetical protein